MTDYRNEERTARQAYEELNHHVTHSPLAMVKWDASFRIIGWSKRAEEITGFRKKHVMGKTPQLFSFYKEEDLSVVEENIKKLVHGEKNKAHFEARMYNKQGEVLNLSVHASVLRDKEGGLISAMTFIEDITLQRKTELRYQRLFENANDGILIMEDDRFIECNEECSKIYGCPKEELLGQTPYDFSPTYQPDGLESQKVARQKIEKALGGEPQVFEWQHLKQNGTPIDTEISLNRLELGDQVFVQAIVRDLTEQKKAQQEQRKSEQLFRKLFLKAPSAMVMVDKDNKVKRVNKSFEELFGYSQQELMDQDIDQIIASKDQYQQVPKMPGTDFRDGRFYTDITRYTKKGQRLELLLGAIPVYLDGEPIAGFGIYVDITDRKRHERKLEKSLEEKQVMLEEIHHRVKNNLAIISGLLQLQVFETENQNLKSVLQDSQLRIQSMATVHELLYQSESFTEISFKKYLEKLVEVMKKTLPFDHQHINVEITKADVSMDINQAIPSAILINELVTNAYKHAFKGQEEGEIRISLEETPEQICLMVEDNGVGLPEDFSMERKSSIGMSLVQSLTQQLKGQLEVESREGGCFRVSFNKAQKRGSSSLYKLNSQ